MGKMLLGTLSGVGLMILTGVSAGEPLAIKSGDTVANVVASQAGKRVTLRLRSGEELTGTVGEVNEQLVHLGELAGQEFFDAAVATKAIDAVIVRTRER
jgi:predicted ABC-type transport system involved in lysophospholipase L1 biosynthesis ATPase subunit